MPAYKFEALDASGKATSGLLDAESPKAARSQLRAQALVPLAVTQVVTAGIGPTGGLRIGGRVFDSTSLAVWTRQLAGLVGSGLPLERASPPSATRPKIASSASSSRTCAARSTPAR